jgi:hypothetical protein
MSNQIEIPATLAGRIELVGRTAYGRHWHGAVADGLGIHRATLWRWMSGDRPARDVDGDLIALLAAERRRAGRRAVDIAAAQRALAAHINRSN